ncbi:MAG: hypothetical protein LBQ68_00950 [Clostridiales bacterium]|jgi:hypothetical protein|nr:hypothetical protein [Clostridiales bacterium]
MKKYLLFGLAGLSIIVIMCVVVVLLHPLRKPTGWIRQDLLKLTPIGTSMDEVLVTIRQKHKERDISVDYEKGYRVNKEGNLDFTNMPEFSIVGEKTICVSMGSYRVVFTTYVDVYYGFDENSELIDILVYKGTDLL